MKTALLASFVFASFLANAATSDKKASVLLMEAKSRSLADSLTFPGRVRSRVNAVQTSEIEGQVLKIEKPLGARIRRGDVVLVLQNTDPVYRYAPIKIRSKADGYLTSLDVSLMARVDRNQNLFTVTDPRDLIIEAEVPAQDVSSLKLGLEAEFKPDPLVDRTMKVKIEGFSPLIDIKTGTATAQFKPLGEPSELRQGQLGQLSLRTNPREAFVLPESAVVYRDDKTFVRVLDKGKVQKLSIELGRRDGDSFEVKSGLSEGLKIVTRASRFVRDGEEVDVQKPDQVN